MLFWIRDVDAPLLAAERDRVVALVRSVVPNARVDEVGSTAVPGVIGKQDLDILVRVPLHELASTRSALDEVFERNPEQFSSERYQGYLVRSDLDVAIQLTDTDGPHDTFLAFVDALRADPELVTRYNALKRGWNGRDMVAYREAKAAFITSVLSAPVNVHRIAL